VNYKYINPNKMSIVKKILNLYQTRGRPKKPTENYSPKKIQPRYSLNQVRLKINIDLVLIPSVRTFLALVSRRLNITIKTCWVTVTYKGYEEEGIFLVACKKGTVQTKSLRSAQEI